MIKKHIPNTITCCNLIAGCIATYWAFQGKYEWALLFIVIGAVFDFFDGMTARLLHVSSPIASAIIFSWLCGYHFHELPSPIAFIMPFTAFIMAAFSALRLAKFNLDERQAMGFIGLPTPANALFWGALIVGTGDFLTTSPYYVYSVIAAVFVFSYLLIAEIPMFALKFKSWGWRGNEVKYIFLLTCIPLLVLPLILFQSISGLAGIIAWYVILSVFTQRKGDK